MTVPWHTREELVYQVVTLANQGVARRAIARALGVSRNTVRGVLVEHQAARQHEHSALGSTEPSRPAGAPGKPAPRPKKIDAFVPRVAELLARFPEITAQRVFEELKTAGFDGGYTAVKKHLRVVRPPPKPTPSLVTPDYGPGEMAESDWSPYTIALGDRRVSLQAFAYVLVYSKRKFFSLHEQCDLHALMAGHVAAFERFDGAAERCKYDSQKPVVLRWEGQQPIYNPAFLAFAAHYEMRPSAVRREHPNDKPTVERSFWEFERSFLNGRSFRDPLDLREQLARWLDEVADTRVQRMTRMSAIERFAAEQPHLLPLPRHPYDTARVVYRVASIDGFVEWQGNRYAVPYDHVTDILPLRITEQLLFVYAADLRCVARHELAPRGAHLTIDPGLHPSPHKRLPDLDQLARAFEHMGENSAEFFRALHAAQDRWCGYHARLILGLRERYATADLDRALDHARRYGAFHHGAVARILAARATPRTLDEYVAEDTARRLELRLDACSLEPRDLDEYDRLPTTSPSPAPATAAHAPAASDDRSTEHPCPENPSATTPSSSGSDDTSNS